MIVGYLLKVTCIQWSWCLSDVVFVVPAIWVTCGGCGTPAVEKRSLVVVVPVGQLDVHMTLVKSNPTSVRGVGDGLPHYCPRCQSPAATTLGTLFYPNLFCLSS